MAHKERARLAVVIKTSIASPRSDGSRLSNESCGNESDQVDFMNKSRRSHVYELRMYQVNEGKMDALKARFGDHTDAIFRRHNMKSIGYWVPEDAPYSQNLFIYILEHPSREDAKKNWAAFQADPEWKKVKADSETNGPLAKHIDSYFMDPTTFSALQ